MRGHGVKFNIQRCSPQGICLSSRPPRGSFSACFALALPWRPSALAWLGLRVLPQPRLGLMIFGSTLHLPWLCLESPHFVSLLCEYKIYGMIWIYHYCGFLTLQLVLTLHARKELECLILVIFLAWSKTLVIIIIGFRCLGSSCLDLGLTSAPDCLCLSLSLNEWMNEWIRIFI